MRLGAAPPPFASSVLNGGEICFESGGDAILVLLSILLAKGDAIEALTKLQEAIAHRHDYAREWKARTGGKVAGYLCTYVPEEILAAAGVLPVRILGGHEPQDLTESHIFGMFCAYCRDVLGQGLLGKYDYLDGMVFTHCCPHIRQTYESWQKHIPTEFRYLYWVPAHVESPHALPFFLAGVKGLKESVEHWLNTTITTEALTKAIAVYNLNRRLLHQVYALRKQDPPAISGAEAMEMVLSSVVMDKAEHNQLLQQFLAGVVPKAVPGVRLMTLGSENDDVELIRLIESLGGVVVMEDNCIGNRYFWNEVNPNGDLLTALTTRYLAKPPCPLRDIDRRRRGDYILELAKEYGVKGVVFLRQKFCDPHAYEIPIVAQMLKEAGLPTLSLELDITVPYGQYRTRIEAFYEMFI